MKRTYVDSSVLIAAFRGNESISRCAMEVLDDPNRKLVVSDFLRLEVLPKPTFLGRKKEVEFMNAILTNAAEDVPCNPDVTAQAIALASQYDIAPMDALHIGAGVAANVDEFVTLEKPTKPICRVSEIRVISLRQDVEEE
ncbi:MAG: PIN domain-containing protein [Deltaproteobacteria bacterium]|nr:PIN domain-containing protein [Deltaproteobacteria bacterium]MBW2068774.1 PIN domain-containing protein [Deltaproteobacteria bacterium]